jgi:hypothetical protein
MTNPIVDLSCSPNLNAASVALVIPDVTELSPVKPATNACILGTTTLNK